jgi:hypothetical protein
MANVRVTALKYHTLHGEEHHAGDPYDVDEALVETLTANGMAVAAPIKTAAALPARAPARAPAPVNRRRPSRPAPKAKTKTKVPAKKKPARRK